MSKIIEEMHYLWRRIRPLATGERAQKQDTILKTGQWELDLTLLFMARGGSRMTISKL